MMKSNRLAYHKHVCIYVLMYVCFFFPLTLMLHSFSNWGHCLSSCCRYLTVLAPPQIQFRSFQIFSCPSFSSFSFVFAVFFSVSFSLLVQGLSGLVQSSSLTLYALESFSKFYSSHEFSGIIHNL